ncbi:hypothetical protein, partial [Kineococcus esterisolvens]|uniref:hypothetical protein n=1 Tax=Kineococcus sp. SYSU DK008 TaxID=3383129 RepID=UPI003D7E2774
MTAVEDVLFYGSSPWDETWLTEHYLSEALSQRVRVLFVDPAFSVLTPLRRHGAVGGARPVCGFVGRPRRREGHQHLLA